MKYIVELKYTNPSHEHVSLRRRVESRNAIVEAANEEEAILRASRQQRALGFMVQEARIVEQKKNLTEEVELDEGMKAKETATRARELADKLSKTDPKKSQMYRNMANQALSRIKTGVGQSNQGSYRDIEGGGNKALRKQGILPAGKSPAFPFRNEEVELDEAKHLPHLATFVPKKDSKIAKDHISIPVHSDHGRESHENKFAKIFGKNVAKEYTLHKVTERTNEEVEQIEEGVATAQKVMDRAKVVANTNPDPKKRFAASGLAQKAMLRTINPTGVNTGIVRGGGNKTYRMITGKVPPYQLTKKTGVSEAVEYIEEKLTAADPASKWISDFVASDNPKFEGKSKKERIRMALGAHYAAKREKNEEVEQIDENVFYNAGETANKKPVGKGTIVQNNRTGIVGKAHSWSVFQGVPHLHVKTHNDSYHSPAKDWLVIDKKNEEVEVNEASKEAKDVMRGLRSSMKSMDLRHGVDSDKRVSGYKMSPVVRAAQKKSDILSKIIKRPQAGTLAAKLRKEAVEKEVKKAEVNQERKKGSMNKLNMKPEIDINLQGIK